MASVSKTLWGCHGLNSESSFRRDEIKVSLANGTCFEIDPGITILDAAKKARVALEYSCRNGRCGVCRAYVAAGQTTALSHEVSLTSDEIASGFVLTCCRSAISDVELDIEDLGYLAGMSINTIPVKVDSIRFLSGNVAEVILRIPPSATLDYRAGQYIEVISPLGVRRSYSIANAPREDRKIKLEIRKVENGVLSQYWFNEAKVNDLLRIEGPLGTFCLRPKPSKNLVLLATGTGIAPVKAILEEVSSSVNSGELSYQQIYLYWGGRVESDLYWQPAFPNLPLKFIPVLSRVNEWSGRVGYVHQAVLDDQVELSDSSVYACGSEAMIRSAKEAMVSAGLHPKQFYSDAFVSSC